MNVDIATNIQDYNFQKYQQLIKANKYQDEVKKKR